MTDEQLLAAINGVKDELLDHIHAVGANLHSQIQALDTRICERSDLIEARLVRQGGLIQGGSRSITRFIGWTEKADTALSRHDRRLSNLEKRSKPPKAGKS